MEKHCLLKNSSVQNIPLKLSVGLENFKSQFRSNFIRQSIIRMTVGGTSPQRADVVCKTPPKESANKKGEMVVSQCV